MSNKFRIASRLVGSDVEKAHLYEFLQTQSQDSEYALIAATSNLLSSSELEELANSIPKSQWQYHFTIMGIAANKNVSKKLFDEIFISNNPIGYLISVQKLRVKKLLKLELHPDPAIRELLQQGERYSNLLGEARSINTSSARLNEIYKMHLREKVPQSFKASFDYDFYEGMSLTPEIFLSEQTLREFLEDHDDFDEIYSDFQIFNKYLESNQNLNTISAYFQLKFVENYEFDYLSAAALANLNMSLDETPQFIEHDAHYPTDLILEEDLPGLHFLLDDVINEAGIEFSAHDCIDWVRSLYQLENADWFAIANDLNSEDFVFYSDGDSGITDYVRASGPFLVANDENFLEKSFNANLDRYLKIAILFNPNCTENIRQNAGKDFAPPIPLMLAKIAVYSRQFHLLPRWIKTHTELDDLYKVCSGQYHTKIREYLSF